MEELRGTIFFASSIQIRLSSRRMSPNKLAGRLFVSVNFNRMRYDRLSSIVMLVQVIEEVWLDRHRPYKIDTQELNEIR